MKPKIGLEIHGYIQTNEKLFCNCKAIHGAKVTSPNTNICPICTAQPGSKPMLPNSVALNKIIEIALILNCKVITSDEPSAVTQGKIKRRKPPMLNPKDLLNTGVLAFQRKHYSWPDLP